MNIEQAREVCLLNDIVEECMPFGDDALVYKIGGKMYAMLSLDIDRRLNVKCRPERATELCDEHPDSITPGYHMNKRHWISIYIDQTDSQLVRQLVEDSYNLVFNALPRRIKAELEQKR